MRNNDLKTIAKLVWRDLRFHKIRSGLLIFTIAIVSALACFCLLLGACIQNGYHMRLEQSHGYESDLIFYGLTGGQAGQLNEGRAVKSTAGKQFIGQVICSDFGFRGVWLAPVDEAFAAKAHAAPTTGRFPEAANEIALDTYTLDALLVPHQLGATVTLDWQPWHGGETQTAEFTLCGFWDDHYSLYESSGWVTSEAAESLAPGYNGPGAATTLLLLDLHQPGDVMAQGEQLLAEAGIEGVMWDSNLAHQPMYTAYADELAAEYYRLTLWAVVCGLLMLFSMLRVVIRQSLPFYVQLKALGMGPHHLRILSTLQNALLALPGIALGSALGFVFYMRVADTIVLGASGRPSLLFLSLWPFGAGALLTLAIVLVAGVFSFTGIAGKTPFQTAALATPKRARRKRRGYRPSTLPRLALATLRKNIISTLLSLAAIALSATMLGVVWFEYASYDADLYLAANTYADYVLQDSSTVWNRYNPESRSIGPGLTESIAAHPAIREFGAVKTQEVSLPASDEAYAAIRAVYDSPDPDGIPYKQAMAGNTALIDAYNKFEETGEYIAVMAGTEAFILEAMIQDAVVLSGEYDAEAFASGRYAVVMNNNEREKQGANYLPTIPVGETVTIGGKTFTVMMEMSDPLFIAGEDSPAATFSYTWFIPMPQFEALWPDTGIRQLVFNIDRAQSASFEAFLDDALEQTFFGVSLTSYTSVLQTFDVGRITEVIQAFINAFTLLLAALLFYGALAASRKMQDAKRFALYESLGMEKAQLRRLTLLESLFQLIAQLAILLPVAGLATWLWAQYLWANTNSWVMTYSFSLTPLWFTAALMALLTFLVPQACLAFMGKTSVYERLQAHE